MGSNEINELTKTIKELTETLSDHSAHMTLQEKRNVAQKRFVARRKRKELLLSGTDS